MKLQPVGEKQMEVCIKLGIKPDIVVYGKSLGNGYAISAIVGKNSYMRFANKTFISSTAWTESIGFNAGIAVIDFLLRIMFRNI